MALRTPEEFKESLRKLRPNVYKFGELIEDVTITPSNERDRGRSCSNLRRSSDC